MIKLAEFVSHHLSDDTAKLILDKGKWPEIDISLAVNCIESRRKLRGKVQEWYDDPRLIFPARLSAEQCSSSATARYKAGLAERIVISSSGLDKNKWKIADLTGGLGVDAWFFSKAASEVLYNEMQTCLCKAAEYNFQVTGAVNIKISNYRITSAECHDAEGISPEKLLSDFKPDIIYMDPARRGEGGRKVFLIEDCTPDVLTLKYELFRTTRHLLIKLSPMADISMVCDRLGSNCREVHVVASGGECKELLVWMDREWRGPYEIVAVELSNDSAISEFRFFPAQEHAAVPAPAEKVEGWIFEPGKALMKAGAFNLTGSRFGLTKLGISTHYYITENKSTAETLKSYGKVFAITNCFSLDKRSMKEIGKSYPKAEVTARNIPITSEDLRKKIGCASGGDTHIFGLRSDLKGNILIIGKRI